MRDRRPDNGRDCLELRILSLTQGSEFRPIKRVYEPASPGILTSLKLAEERSQERNRLSHWLA
jgi:hypothetical protein